MRRKGLSVRWSIEVEGVHKRVYSGKVTPDGTGRMNFNLKGWKVVKV